MSDQIYMAAIDEIPHLTLQPHEICEPVTSAEVVVLWDKLKERCEAAEKELAELRLAKAGAAEKRFVSDPKD